MTSIYTTFLIQLNFDYYRYRILDGTFSFCPKLGRVGFIAGITLCTWGKRGKSNAKASVSISGLHRQISPIPRAENTDIRKSLFARMGQRDSFLTDYIFFCNSCNHSGGLWPIGCSSPFLNFATVTKPLSLS